VKDIQKLIPLLNPQQIVGEVHSKVSSICYNSHLCEPYSMFFAISGTKTDGHLFIDSAIDKGARYCVCERLPENLRQECTYIVVENTRVALAAASNFWFGYPSDDLTVVGVTGTNGKTTITYLLKAIMEEFGKKSAVIGTIGAFAEGYTKRLSNTTPESYELFKMFYELKKLGVEFVAMEVSSHSLVQKRVYGIDFDGAIFTNLTQDHLDYHKDMEDYARAKSLLFKSLKSDAVVVAFADSPYSVDVVSQTPAKNVFFVSRSPNYDVQIVNERIGLDFSEFELVFNKQIEANSHLKFQTPLQGRFNIENAALASVMALALGVDFPTIQNALRNFAGVSGRMQKVNLKNGAIGIVDYAHTPDALEKALQSCREVLDQTGSGGRLIVVFGCGGERDQEKRPLMGKIASEIADYVVLTNDNPRKENPSKIINQIYCGISNEGKKRVIQIGNRDEAIEYAYNLSKQGDIILVAGKGHEDYQIIGEVKYHFSDVEQLQRFGV